MCPLCHKKISHKLDVYVVHILAENSSNVGFPASFQKLVLGTYGRQVQGLIQSLTSSLQSLPLPLATWVIRPLQFKTKTENRCQFLILDS